MPIASIRHKRIQQRDGWAKLPPEVQSWLQSEEHGLGEFVEYEAAEGGISTCYAGRTRFRQKDGTEKDVFLKAVPKSDSKQFEMVKGEIDIHTQLSDRGVAVPPAIAHGIIRAREEQWIVFAQTYISNASSLGNPWTESDFRQLGHAIQDLEPHLASLRTERPVSKRISEAVPLSVLRAWNLIPPELKPDDLAKLDESLKCVPAAARGKYLIHGDMADSNILRTDDGIKFVDWHPKEGPLWAMFVPVAISAHASRVVDVNRVFAEHQLTKDVPPEHINAFLASIASKLFYGAHGRAPAGRGGTNPADRGTFALWTMDLLLRRHGIEPPPEMAGWIPTAKQPSAAALRLTPPPSRLEAISGGTMQIPRPRRKAITYKTLAGGGRRKTVRS